MDDMLKVKTQERRDAGQRKVKDVGAKDEERGTATIR